MPQAESSPQEDARCSKSEREYIEASTVKRVCHSCASARDGYTSAEPEQSNCFEGKQERLVCCAQKPAQEIPWKLLLSKAPVWALIVCHFCHNWGTFILLTWMPTYYNQACFPMHRCPCTPILWAH